jgi:hypothetical protein
VSGRPSRVSPFHPCAAWPVTVRGHGVRAHEDTCLLVCCAAVSSLVVVVEMKGNSAVGPSLVAVANSPMFMVSLVRSLRSDTLTLRSRDSVRTLRAQVYDLSNVAGQGVMQLVTDVVVPALVSVNAVSVDGTATQLRRPVAHRCVCIRR